MGAVGLDGTKELISGHLGILRDYAKKVLVGQGTLDMGEEAEKERRIQELFTVASSLGLTMKETVVLLYKPLFIKPACECSTCRFRRGSWS